MTINNKGQNWKSIRNVKDELNDDADISNLNDDDSFVPMIEKNKEPLTDEEKKDIRKRIFCSLIIVFIVLIGLILVLIFNPFKKERNPVETNESKEDINNEQILFLL